MRDRKVKTLHRINGIIAPRKIATRGRQRKSRLCIKKNKQTTSAKKQAVVIFTQEAKKASKILAIKNLASKQTKPVVLLQPNTHTSAENTKRKADEGFRSQFFERPMPKCTRPKCTPLIPMAKDLAIGMKLALRYIPTEVWVDVFCYPWISREELGRIVHRFRNRYIAEILQYCLHERGKRKLNNIILDQQHLPLIPQTPMPENIKIFDHITIGHFDARALDFFHRISPVFMFNDVHLRIISGHKDDLANLGTVLDHLSPMLHGIYSLIIHHCALPIVEEYFGPTLTQIKLLMVYIDARIEQAALQTAINFFMNWLTAEERDSNEPRLLSIPTYSRIYQQFSMAVKQQFLSARSPCTFAIFFRIRDSHNQVENFELTNNLGEKLHGIKHGLFRICRYQGDLATTKLPKWMRETLDKCRDTSSRINIVRHLTLGQLDANAGANEVNDTDEDEEEQLSTSG